MSDDTNDIKDSSEVPKGSKFVLHLDGMRNVKQQQLAAARDEQTNNTNATSSLDNTNVNEGLRRRHQSTTATSTTATHNDNPDTKSNKWTEDAPTFSNNNEEEQLQQQQYTDPLNLFGIPPPALRVAQSKSRSAIAYYVEVANLAKEIIRITNENEGNRLVE